MKIKENILALFRKLPTWGRNFVFIVAGFSLGIGGVSLANPGHIVEKTQQFLAPSHKDEDKNVTNNDAATNPSENDNSTRNENLSSPKQKDDPKATPAPTHPPESKPAATPAPIPQPEDKSLQGIEGLVPSIHVGEAIYAPVVTTKSGLVVGTTSMTYQWRVRIGHDQATGDQIYANIPGATSNPYYPTSEYLNKWISVVVTGTNGYTGSLPSPTDALVN